MGCLRQEKPLHRRKERRKGSNHKSETINHKLSSKNEHWDLSITPKDRLLALDWKEIWRYRDMFLLFVARNFRTAYKQTVLGPLWFIITPVLSVIVYVAVFGGIANIPTDGVPPILFYLLGISVWGYFASCLSATSNSFVTNADIFGKVYFPRIIMPLVAVTTNLLSFAIQLAIFVAFYIYYIATGTELIIHWQLVLFPFLILLLAFMAVGFGMIFSSMTTKYRDLQIMLNKIISLWVYVTPVIYPLSMVTNEKLHLAMSLNPVTPVMEAIKYSLLGQGQFSWLWLGYSAAFTLILLVFGLMLFNKVQKSFMDTV
ncbi:MAG: ABC transporter permease [Paludibacteraceae bacterium]|nr:ABC transporter permease [Paludibacteraceae bacterium]